MGKINKLFSGFLALLVLGYSQPSLPSNLVGNTFVSAVMGQSLPVPSYEAAFRTSLPAGAGFARTSVAWCINASGTLVQVASATPCFDYDITTLANKGLVMEAASTNLALWNRDLTNAAWSKTNGTVAKDQTGIDAVGNSASSFTATSANATVLQTVTQAATNATYSVYLKRISGTGTIQTTQDGGATWQTVTLTSSWARYAHAVQSVLNPQFGIRIVTSGDVIAVDVNQFENKAFATSPILTTTASVARTNTALSLTLGSWWSDTAGTIALSYAVNGRNASGFLVSAQVGTTGGASSITIIDEGGNLNAFINGVRTSGPVGGYPASTNAVLTYNASGNTLGASGILYTGAGVNSNARNTLLLGCSGNGGSSTIDGWIKSFRYWNPAIYYAKQKRASLRGY